MRLLFEMDKKDYGQCTHSFVRNSARSIIIRGNKVAMIYSHKYDYYKFPGGGIENNEDHVNTLIREISEETGLRVLTDSIHDYGSVLRIQKSRFTENEIFEQENFYYLCNVENSIHSQSLDL